MSTYRDPYFTRILTVLNCLFGVTDMLESNTPFITNNVVPSVNQTTVRDTSPLWSKTGRHVAANSN